METSRRLPALSFWSLISAASVVLGVYFHSIIRCRLSLTFGYLQHRFLLEISSYASNGRGVC
jgi:hypothetical protein